MTVRDLIQQLLQHDLTMAVVVEVWPQPGTSDILVGDIGEVVTVEPEGRVTIQAHLPEEPTP